MKAGKVGKTGKKYLVLSFVFSVLGQGNLALANQNTLFLAGDQAYQKRNGEVFARQALTIYEKILKENPDNADAAWRFSMANYYLGLHYLKDSQQKEKAYFQGQEAALKGIALNSSCSPCYFWAAINGALYGETVGVIKMLFSLNKIKEYIEESIRLDPSYAYGGGYRLLGLIYQKVPGFFGGSNEKAKNYFLQAIKVSPDEPLNYLFLARLMKSELGDDSEARIMIQRGLSLPQLPRERIESHEALNELRSLSAQNLTSP